MGKDRPNYSPGIAWNWQNCYLNLPECWSSTYMLREKGLSSNFNESRIGLKQVKAVAAIWVGNAKPWCFAWMFSLFYLLQISVPWLLSLWALRVATLITKGVATLARRWWSWVLCPTEGEIQSIVMHADKLYPNDFLCQKSCKRWYRNFEWVFSPWCAIILLGGGFYSLPIPLHPGCIWQQPLPHHCYSYARK